jgi:uncharacterized protein DUF2764
MANYYFLATLLPPLKMGTPPELGSKELNFLLKQELTTKDLEKIAVLRFLTDLENIRNIWLQQPLQTGGNYSEQELREMLAENKTLPRYMVQFLNQYPEIEDRLVHFPELLRAYFEKESKSKDAFLGPYLCFEWQWRLVFVALRAKELDRDIKYELRFENPQDPFIADIIAQNEAKTFEPPAPYTSLKALFEARKHAPLELFQALCEWRFDHVKQMIDWQCFSTARILGYVAQLEICERWLELNKRKGLQLLEEMIET